MPTGRLLGMCGSLRKDSYNRKLMRLAEAAFAPEHFDDANLRLPLYDGDIEVTSGIPDDVQLLADQIAGADAVLVVGPEYNKGISGVLKNALDWVSRTKGGPWSGKPVAVLSATAGRSGGERAQDAMRLCLRPFRPTILPGPEVLVGSAPNEFDENGQLLNARSLQDLQGLMDALRAEAGLPPNG